MLRQSIFGQPNLPEFDGDMMDAKYAVIAGTDPTDSQKAEWGKVKKNI